MRRLRVGPENHQQSVDDDDGQPDQQNELLIVRTADEGIDQRRLQHEAHGKERGRNRRDGNQRVEPIEFEQEKGRIHRDHRELAMREVHHPDDAENHRQPERHQPVDEPGQNALDDDVEIDRPHRGLVCGSGRPVGLCRWPE